MAVIVTAGSLHFTDGKQEGVVDAGGLFLIDPGERHSYWADVETAAYLVFAGLQGVRSRPWTLRER